MTRNRNNSTAAGLGRVWPPHAFRFGGGSSGGSVAQTPVAAAVPPVTSSAAEVVQQSQDLRRQSLKKRGFAGTIYGGDDGGWFPSNNTPSPAKPQQTPSGNPSGTAGKLGG